jgi:orotate phosphoribosyltransferase
MTIERLREIILEKSFQYSDEPIYELAYAGKSKFYFNCKPTVLDPEGAGIISQLVFNEIQEFPVSAVGGLELGSVPISSMVTLLSQLNGKPIKGFIVRKRTKDHGIPTKIEGELTAGEKVVIVDDVITTGKSTVNAIKAVQDIGVEVEKVVILVDREEHNGKQHIQDHCKNVVALVKCSEIMDMYKQRYTSDKIAV